MERPSYLSYNQRVLVSLFEDIAHDSPERLFSVLPKSDNLQDGFINLSFPQAVQAVNFLAFWLKSRLGPKPDYDFETLTYFGLADVRYPLLTLASIKCGYKTFFPSFRNTVAINVSLMGQTRSTKLIYSDGYRELAESLTELLQGLQIFQLPSLQEVLASKAEPTLYKFTFEEALNHPIIVLHSSGSTGPPKPITYTNGTIASLGADWSFKPPEDRKIVGLPLYVRNGRECHMFGPMPPFHLGGVYLKTVVPILSMGVPVYHPATRAPSPELILEVMQHHDIHAVSLPPSLIEGLLHLTDGLEQLKRLDWIMFAGGPLSQVAGDEIMKYTTLIPYYGSTEVMAVRQVVPQQENWSYLEFHPDDRFRMEPQIVDEDVYELVALHDPSVGPNNAGSAAVYHSLPGTTIYPTKDLFKRHPTLDLWQFYGRKDDILVLSSGEKINPIPMEIALTNHPAVAGALVVAQGHPRPALVVEPKSDARNHPALLDEIWVAVQKINKNTPGPGRVSRDMIIVGDPQRPFFRTGKGTMIRKLTNSSYEGDLKALFESPKLATVTARPLNFPTTQPEILNLIRKVVSDVLPNSPMITDSSNLYLCGMDSLTTADASASLSRQLGQQSWLTPNLFYTNPSIEGLASAIHAHLNDSSTIPFDNQADRLKNVIARMMEGLPVENIRTSNEGSDLRATDAPQGRSFVITGTTGNLGCMIASKLAESSDVERVICLNRTAAARERWLEASKPSARARAKVVFYHIDLTQSSLGLSDNGTMDVQSSDIFIHNAWKVNFNQNLTSFEDNLQGLCNILKLCNSAAKPPRFVFISSVSVSAGSRQVPEAGIDDFSACAPMGYGESKFVAEHMVDEITSASPSLRATVLRVGQIAGSSEPGGAPWPEKEAFPGMFRTSKSLGLVPDNLPPVNWVPIDRVVTAVIELSIADLKDQSQKLSYYNVVNPHQTQWKELVQPMKEYCGEQSKTVPLRDWINALLRFDQTDRQHLADKPALKTVDFFQLLASQQMQQSFDTAHATTHSPSLANLRSVDAATLRRWLLAL